MRLYNELRHLPKDYSRHPHLSFYKNGIPGLLQESYKTINWKRTLTVKIKLTG